MTFAGDVTTFVASKSTLSKPAGIVMNHKENVFFVANYGSNTINKISSSGMETSLALHSFPSFSPTYQGVVSVFTGNGKFGTNDGDASNARFKAPTWIAIDQETGNLFVNDRLDHTIRKITPQGELAYMFFFFHAF